MVLDCTGVSSMGLSDGWEWLSCLQTGVLLSICGRIMKYDDRTWGFLKGNLGMNQKHDVVRGCKVKVQGGPLNLQWAPDVGEGAGSGVREDKGRERRDERRERL